MIAGKKWGAKEPSTPAGVFRGPWTLDSSPSGAFPTGTYMCTPVVETPRGSWEPGRQHTQAPGGWGLALSCLSAPSRAAVREAGLSSFQK